jgi:hypothetical protein
MDKGLLAFSEQSLPLRRVSAPPFRATQGPPCVSRIRRLRLGHGGITTRASPARRAKAQASFRTAQFSRTGLRHRADHS